MKRLLGPLSAVLAMLLPYGVSPVRADFMNWSFSWTLANHVGPTFTNGTADATVSLSQGGSGASTIPVGTISTHSSPHTSESFNVPYELALNLTDNTTGDSAGMTFQGNLAGSVGLNGKGLTNSYSNPHQSLTLDGHVYNVAIDPSTFIPNSSDGPPVPINATCSVSGGKTDTAPEPPALLLAGIALAMLGTVCLTHGRRHPRSHAGS
jgi:hypothetical protein